MPAQFGFSDERVRRFMYATFDWLLSARDPELGYPRDDQRLVQRWAWFSMAYPPFPTGDLIDAASTRLCTFGD